MGKPHTSIVQSNKAAAMLPFARSLKTLIEWMEEEEIHEITLPKLRSLHEEFVKKIGYVEERSH